MQGLFAFLLTLNMVSTPSCPDGMVPTGVGSCIDIYPWPNEPGTKPVVGLSAIPEQRDVDAGLVYDIETVCASVGKRPCNRREWVSACRGEGGAPYPWGWDLPRVYGPGELPCNCDKRYIPYNERAVWLRDVIEWARLDQFEPNGTRPTCVSWSGARDMIGQVEEWVRCPRLGRDGWCLMGGHVARPAVCESTIASHSGRWHLWATSGRCCVHIDG